MIPIWQISYWNNGSWNLRWMGRKVKVGEVYLDRSKLELSMDRKLKNNYNRCAWTSDRSSAGLWLDAWVEEKVGRSCAAGIMRLGPSPVLEWIWRQMTINQAGLNDKSRKSPGINESFFILLPSGFWVPGICPKYVSLSELVAGRLGRGRDA